ncbi:MAG: 50S ribosomal protein L4 [Meiothermus sp.]|uniref:50S ribosomal protein L4 n=1 Tax=Meiothermus sp. TaxID=1955249 RepID=UPI0025EFDE25|nr:50S ribosomal protein L4 [Meiothermus sp.]MCS7194106.1 50S ribosomal protein L4 [Meiothermus sp.]MDW8091528.1 50S ribosomal protein L4 [Meiothermus sp.]
MYSLPVLGSDKTVEAQLPGINPHVLYEVVRWQLASRRRGTAATKTRGMVSYTSKKMYPQKHTGRARHGDYGAPIFVGGGTAFGPQPRDYSYTLPKKVRRLALGMALADRAQQGKLFLVERFEGVEGKTREFVAWLRAHNLEGPSLLLVTSNPLVARSARNLPQVRILDPEGINVYDILRQEVLVMEASAWDAVKARLGGEGQ